jgi:hydrogenase nickel incorporation protein HypB
VRIALDRDLRSANQEDAAKNRGLFVTHGVRVVNMMSSPGSGKTTLLERTAAHFEKSVKLGVLVGDLSTQRDAERIRLASAGIQCEQIVTEDYGSACRLSARMIAEALPRLDLRKIDLLFIENVGNLVCPAGLYLGEDRRAVLLSVPEGDDKVKKYPVIFRDADLLLITKIDLLSGCDFDPEKVKAEARDLKGNIDILSLSSRTAEGLEGWYDWLETCVLSS